MIPEHRLRIQHADDIWEILSQGTSHGGKVYCHLASTTRGRYRMNGWMPIQMADWIPQEKILAAALMKEESKRRDFCKNGPHKCVPWRGANGDLGACIYCGSDALEGKE